MPDQTPPPSCRPGDFTVSQIPTGYLIGRALEKRGPGPWWEYIAIVPDHGSAVAQVTQLARQEGVRAWLHKHGEEYEPIFSERDMPEPEGTA